MTIFLNGEAIDLSDSEFIILADFLNQRGYQDFTSIVVAINQTIVAANTYHDTRLNDQDKVDVLGAITGG